MDLFIAGVIAMGTAPCLAQASFTSGRAITLLMPALSLSTISFGVPAGAMTPWKAPSLNPGTPDSEIVGISGATVERFAPEVASARAFAAFTCGSMMTMFVMKS